MKVISMQTAKRQGQAARHITKGRRDDEAEIAGYRRQLRAHIRKLERAALKGPQDDPARIAAVKNLSAIVLVMFVAEHDLRQDIHRAVDATLVA